VPATREPRSGRSDVRSSPATQRGRVWCARRPLTAHHGEYIVTRREAVARRAPGATPGSDAARPTPRSTRVGAVAPRRDPCPVLRHRRSTAHRRRPAGARDWAAINGLGNCRRVERAETAIGPRRAHGRGLKFPARLLTIVEPDDRATDCSLRSLLLIRSRANSGVDMTGRLSIRNWNSVDLR
jgi:hypothetical protein